MSSRVLSGVALAAAAAVMFSTVAVSTASADEGQGEVRGCQFLQGTLRLQERQQRLQGAELLQGQGVPRDDAGAVRRSQGESEGWRLRLFRAGRAARPARVCPAHADHSRRSASDSGCASRTTRRSSRRIPAVDWFEVISENYMLPGGQPAPRMLERIRARYPVVMHGVSLSIASTAPPNFEYLHELRELAGTSSRNGSQIICAGPACMAKNLHDLLPIPLHPAKRSTTVVQPRADWCRIFSAAPIALENVSTYVQFNNSEMTEWEFLSQLSRRSGCWLLFDVNNVYVSAFNHGYDPRTFLEGIPADRVVQFHMAGHSHMGTHIIDTHDHPVCEDEVWEL